MTIVRMACAAATPRRRYVGNHQVIELARVVESVDVIGNHNSVTVRDNRAAIRIVGNACTVRVHAGDGRVRVVGNNGTVALGAGVDVGRVACVGNASRVVRFGDEHDCPPDGDRSPSTGVEVAQDARFEARQGFLRIDNCVSVKAGRTGCVRF